MKTLSIKSQKNNFDKEVINLAKENGFTLSDLGGEQGELLTLMIGDDSRLIGYNLLGFDTVYNAYEILDTDNIEIVEDWIKDHETSS